MLPLNEFFLTIRFIIFIFIFCRNGDQIHKGNWQRSRRRKWRWVWKRDFYQGNTAETMNCLMGKILWSPALQHPVSTTSSLEMITPLMRWPKGEGEIRQWLELFGMRPTALWRRPTMLVLLRIWNHWWPNLQMNWCILMFIRLCRYAFYLCHIVVRMFLLWILLSFCVLGVGWISIYLKEIFGLWREVRSGSIQGRLTFFWKWSAEGKGHIPF